METCTRVRISGFCGCILQGSKTSNWDKLSIWDVYQVIHPNWVTYSVYLSVPESVPKAVRWLPTTKQTIPRQEKGSALLRTNYIITFCEWFPPSDILFGISSDILSGILPDILPHIFFDILSGILSGFLFYLTCILTFCLAFTLTCFLAFFVANRVRVQTCPAAPRAGRGGVDGWGDEGIAPLSKLKSRDPHLAGGEHTKNKKPKIK